MQEMIVTHWDSILVVVIFILVIFYLLKRGATKQVNQMLFYLVTEAERDFGSGTGQLKYAAVVTWLYEKLPLIVKILFTEKQIDNMIEQAVQDMKKYLESNINAKVLITE